MDIRKLQRAIVDGLEDVKGQHIAVFNTEHLSSMFERVIIASGTSNRQTKALAASVRDSVRKANFPIMSTEGEDNGEWIIVDCGAAVAHIMQPAIREYYHLEEIWGGKNVRVKVGDVSGKLVKASEGSSTKRGNKGVNDVPSLRRSSAAKTAVRAAEKEARAVKAASAEGRSTGRRKPAAAPTTAKVAAKRATAKKPVAKKAVAKRAVANKAVAKKAPVKKVAAKKSISKPRSKA
jgi:ribosome-associated protein